ncbi:Aspartate aminotransferase [Olavius algarvensis spirochete endosymbiont]|uniref:pyridoxal phosphate-dependent aminotransferase n=1 Tax=Olavius algarvensis spirochete endosymbiont TaxID=260710 RepID=UPI00068CAD4B|nr:pyridoxal phosphate-dependent aminotransferase [Olavius algarvensis spirochete endosymbiont]VDB00609.1 Aspartate aminotransferase [Olavius algarvensis spirochete endosymbiont]
MEYRLSDAAHNLHGQPMFKMLGRIQELEREGKEIIQFEIGDPDFSTPENITNVAIESLVNGEVHYTSSYGMYEFREVVASVTQNSRGFTPAIEQIVITPGANIIVYYAIRCLVNPGDEVVVPDPGFPTYYSVIDFCGVKPVRVPLREENGFRMNPQDLRDVITKRTRLIILNSPQNPTGAVITPEEILEIYQIAEEHDVYIYSDEVYSRMLFANALFCSSSVYDSCKRRTILANGFSKAFAMTGWRLGAVIAPTDVAEKMALLLETTSSCVSPFVQRAGIEAAIGDQEGTRAMMREYRKRRDIIVEELNNIPGVTCLMPGGAFYVFPSVVGTGLSSKEFADFALEEAGVALLPGTNFGQYGEGFVRLCYANSQSNIRRGMARLKTAVQSL